MCVYVCVCVGGGTSGLAMEVYLDDPATFFTFEDLDNNFFSFCLVQFLIIIYSMSTTPHG